MKWIVTGGTGFIGRKLAEALALRGDEVVIFSRREGEASGRARKVKWTPEEPGDWMREVDGADVVAHLAGEPIAVRWTDERLGKIRSSRTVPTGLIARAIAEATKKPSVLLSASAIGIYGMRKDDEELDESSPLGKDIVADICAAWEKAAAPAGEAGVRVCHPRIGIGLGRESGALSKMLPAFRAFVGGPIGDGKQWVSFIHVSDVVRALLFCADHAAVTGPVNLTAPRPVIMNELASTMARALHRPNFFRVPKFALKLALGEMAEIALTGQRVFPKKLLDSGFEFLFPTLDSALQDLL